VPPVLGYLTVGTDTSKSKMLTIKNAATKGEVIGNVPAGSAPFTVTAGSGPFDLLPGQKKPATVQYAPTAPGASAETLVITSNDPVHPSVKVKLSGTGASGKLVVPAHLIFLYPQAIGIGITKNLTIRNEGLGVLHGNVGTSTGPFAVTAGSGGFTLDHLQTRTVTIQFTPPASGPFIGVLPITSDDPKHVSFNVNLKGTGK